MGLRWQLLSQQIIEVGIQFASGHDRRILLFQRAGSRVTGIGEQGFLLLLSLLVQPIELGPRQQHLASDLESRRIIRSLQAQGDGSYRFDIGRHIVTPHAIATGHRLDEASLLVDQRDGGAIVFQLGHQFERLVQRPAHLLIEIAHLRLGIGVAQREHRVLMHDLGELLGEITAYTMRGRIGIVVSGIGLLQLLQLTHLLVELKI